MSQVWIELVADDPEAKSACLVARERLAAAKRLERVRRARVIELSGRLPKKDEQAELLHRSTQFYNPHKERCTIRARAQDRLPLEPGEQAIVVCERGAERRPSAERWWRHETGEAIEVREAVAWMLTFEPGASAAECAAELAVLRDRRHGLFCNPHAQALLSVGGDLPLGSLSRDRADGGEEGGDERLEP